MISIIEKSNTLSPDCSIQGSDTDSFIQLFNKDCIDVLKDLGTDSIDLIVTDPPYNLGLFMKNRQTNRKALRKNFFVSAGWDNLGYDEWIIFMENFFREISRVIKIGGSMILFMSIQNIATIVELAEKYGFYYKTTGIWHKTNPLPTNMNLHFVNAIEGWIYFTYKKKTGTFNNNGCLYHNFFETSVAATSERKFGKHPTQKPELLIKPFVKLLSNPGDVVLDPFMGSGTTGVIAKRENRNFIGIEINDEYYSMAQKRISNDRGD